MKMTVGSLIDLSAALDTLSNRQFSSVAGSYRLSRLRGQVIHEMQTINDSKQKIQTEFMDKKDNLYVAKPGMQGEVDSRWTELRTTEIDIELHRMKLEDFDNMSMTVENAARVPYVPEPWIIGVLVEAGCLQTEEEKSKD